MSNANLYNEQTQLKTQEYSMPLNKRKCLDQEHLTPITAKTILDRMAKETPQLEPAAKRRQTQTLFRPWLEEDNKKKSTGNQTQAMTATVLNSQTNKSSPVMQQPRRNRQHLIELIKRYNKEAQQWLIMQQQFAYYQQYQAAVMSQNFHQANYLRQIQQMALQRQGQLFVFGNQ